jgi:transcriptional regulator with XRE-family HTH domain
VGLSAVASTTARREWLSKRRKTLGLTQEALAGLVNVDRSTVVRWESGKTQPHPWVRPKLAEALGVTAERLEENLADGTAGSVPDPAAWPGADAVVVPRQLPVAVTDCTGRSAELRALTRIVDGAGARPPGTVVISAIGGTAGVGKTALALHWAHQVAGRFEDGQLYVNLRGFDPSGVPATSAEAIRGFLDALGAPPESVPQTPQAQAGLYRSLVSAKRMLIVRDNARDGHQVRPLLPATDAPTHGRAGTAGQASAIKPSATRPAATAVAAVTAYRDAV